MVGDGGLSQPFSFSSAYPSLFDLIQEQKRRRLLELHSRKSETVTATCSRVADCISDFFVGSNVMCTEAKISAASEGNPDSWTSEAPVDDSYGYVCVHIHAHV